MQTTMFKIVKLSEQEYAFLKQSLLYVHFYGNLDDSGKAQLQALLSKLDSAVVERARGSQRSKPFGSGDAGTP